MYNYKIRDEVPEKYKWDLTDFFKNDDEFNEVLKKTTKEIESLKNYKGCTKDANKIYEFLENRTNISANIQLLYFYATLKNDETLGIKENIERESTTQNLYSKLKINTNFFDEELLKLNDSNYKKLFKDCEKLKEYKHLLDKVYRNKKHTLTENQENIISELTSALDNSSNIYRDLINREHNYGTITLEDKTIENITINNYSKLMRNKNREIRKKVYTSFNEKLNEYGNTTAGLLNSYVKGNNTIAKLHKFTNAWEAKLFELNLDNKVFKVLTNTCEKNINSYQKYFKLKKKILKIDELHTYDLGLELSRNDKEYTIEEAQDLIKKALSPLGEKYLSIINEAFDNRWIDYIGYKGKCSGGYTTPNKLKNPKILIKYNSNFSSISILIHELGHAIQQKFIIENNPIQYRYISNLVAEVASLTNECLLSNYLMNKSNSKEEKLSGIENMINVIKSNLFMTNRESKIEQQMYEYINNGGTLSKDYLDKLVSDSYKLYNSNYVIENDLSNVSWIQRNHYYMNFYLYNYAISISVAINVSNEILKGNKEMLDKYIKFLSTGSNVWPNEAFKILGIDLTDELIYITAIKYFETLLDTFEKIYYDKEGE